MASDWVKTLKEVGDNFTLGKRIGSGNSSDVFEATDKGMDQNVH